MTVYVLISIDSNESPDFSLPFTVYTVVTYLKNEMNRGDFFMTLRNQPVALSLYRQVPNTRHRMLALNSSWICVFHFCVCVCFSSVSIRNRIRWRISLIKMTITRNWPISTWKLVTKKRWDPKRLWILSKRFLFHCDLIYCLCAHLTEAGGSNVFITKCSRWVQQGQEWICCQGEQYNANVNVNVQAGFSIRLMCKSSYFV